MKHMMMKAVLGLAMLLGMAAWAAPASAQATRTWISGVGDDVNPCSRTAPCKTFQGAIAKTAAGGEINCLDPGGFGSVTITKSISIICDNTETGILVASTNAIIINSTTATVVLSGLDLEGLGQTGSPGINGINILNANAVHVLNSKIRGFRNGFGINFQPQNATAHLYVNNVIISESGNASTTSGGILINPVGATSTARVTIDDVRLIDNLGAGLRVDTTGVPAAVTAQVTIRNTTIDNNANGLLVVTPASTGVAQVMITDTTIAGNIGLGLVGNGATAKLRVGRTTITGNATGVLAGGGAIVNSYGNNFLDGNTANGAFTAGIIPSS